MYNHLATSGKWWATILWSDHATLRYIIITVKKREKSWSYWEEKFDPSWEEIRALNCNNQSQIGNKIRWIPASRPSPLVGGYAHNSPCASPPTLISTSSFLPISSFLFLASTEPVHVSNYAMPPLFLCSCVCLYQMAHRIYFSAGIS